MSKAIVPNTVNIVSGISLISKLINFKTNKIPESLYAKDCSENIVINTSVTELLTINAINSGNNRQFRRNLRDQGVGGSPQTKDRDPFDN